MAKVDWKKVKSDLDAVSTNAKKAKKKGLDPKEVNELLASARKSLKEEKKGDFNKSFNKAKKILAKFEKEENKLNEFKKRLGELHNQFNLMALKNSDMTFKDLEKELEKISNAIGDRKLKTINKMLRDGEKSLKTRGREVDAIRAIDDAQAVIDEAAEQKAFLSKARGQVTRAKNALEKKKYPTVHKHCKMAIKLAEGEVKKLRSIKIKEKIQSVSNFLKSTKDMKLDLSEPQEHLKKARDLLKNREFEDALEASREAENKTNYLIEEFERIKGTPRYKELEKAFLSIEDRIAYLDARDYDTSKFKKRHQDLYMVLYQNKLDKAEDGISHLDEEIISIIDVMKNEDMANESLDAISFSAAYIIETKGYGIDVLKAQKVLAKAESAYENEKYGYAKEMAKEAKKQADVLKYNHFDRFPKRIMDDATRVLSNVKEHNVEIPEADKYYSLAKEMFDKMKFETGKKYAKMAIDSAKTVHHEYVNEVTTKQIAETKNALEDIQGLGLDTTEAEDLLAKAQEMLGDDEEFVHALDYAEQAKKVADNKLQSEYVRNSAEKAIEATKSQLIDLKEEGLDVGDLEDQIAQAEQMLERENYVVAMDYISQAKDKSMGLQRKYIINSVQSNLSDTQALIKESQDLGIDLSEVEGMLSEAESLFQSEDFTQAKDLSVKAMDSLHNARQEHFNSLAEDTISSSQFIVAEAKSSGIDVAEAEMMLKQAESMFKDNDYEQSYMLAIDAENLTKKSWETFRTQTTINAVEEVHHLLKEAEDLGDLELNDAKSLLSEAEQFMASKDYDTAIDKASQAEDIILKEKEEFATSTVPSTLISLQTQLDDMEKYGLDVSDATNILAEAEAEFKQQDLSGAHDHIKKVYDSIEGMEDEYYKAALPNLMDNAKSAIDEATDMGLDLGTANALFIEAQDMLRKENYKESYQNVTSLFNITDEAKTKHLSMTLGDEIESQYSVLDEMRDFGVEVVEVEEMLKEAEGLFKEDDILKAQDLYEKALEKKQSYMMEFLPQDLDSVHDLLDEAVEYGMDVNDAEALLGQAEELFNQQDFVGAKRHLEQAKQITVERREEHLTQMANSAIDSTKNLIQEAATRGADVGPAMTALQDAQTALVNQDFDHVQDLVKRAAETANTALQSSKKKKQERQRQVLSDSLAEVRDILNHAREEGGENVDEIQAKLDQVDSILQMNYIPDEEMELATGLITNAREESLKSRDTSKYKFAMEAMESSIMLINSVKGFGIDVTEAENVIRQWQEAISKGDFSQNEEYSQKIQDIINRLRKPFQSRMVSNALTSMQAEIAEARKNGLNTVNVEKMLSEASKAFEKGEIDEAEMLTKQTEKTMMSIRDKWRSGKIKEDYERGLKELEDAKNVGADVSGAEKLIDQVKAEMDREDFASAEQTLKQAMEVIADQTKSYSAVLSQKNIEKALMEIEDLKNLGADTHNVQQILSSAQDLYIKQDFQQANQFALNATDMANDLKKQMKKKKAAEKINKARDDIKYLRSFKAKIDPATGPLANARTALKEERYDEALQFADETQEILDQLKQPHLNKIATDTLAKAIGEIKSAKAAGANVTSAVNNLQKAQKTFDTGKFQEAYDLATQAFDEAHEAMRVKVQDAALDKIKEFEAKIMDLRASGVDVKFAEGCLRKAELSFDNKDFNSIDMHLNKAQDSLKEAIERSTARRAESAIFYTESMIKYIKTNMKGTFNELKKAEMFIKKAEMLSNKKNYEASAKMAEQASRVVENSKIPNLEQFMFVFKQLQAVEQINAAKKEFTRIRQEQPTADLSPAEELLKAAEMTFEDEEAFNDGKEMVLQSRIMALEIERSHIEVNVNNELAMLNSQLIQVKQSGKNITGPEKDYNTAKNAFDVKDFKKAMAFIRKSRTGLEKIAG
jgi:hypothetical protein